MTIERIYLRIFPALDRSVRFISPENYPYLCYQVSIVLNELLLDEGYQAKVVSGDFEVLARNILTGEPEFHGFTDVETDTSHFWVEAENHLIDIMPRYLTKSCRTINTTPPAICWDMSEPLHPSLRYKVKNADPDLNGFMKAGDLTLIDSLYSDVKKRLSRKGSHLPARPFLRGPSCISKLAKKHDPWAAFAEQVIPKRKDSRISSLASAFSSVPSFQIMYANRFGAEKSID